MAASTNTVTVVRLEVAADGALRDLDRFDRELQDTAQSAVKAGSATDAFAAQLQRMNAAQKAGRPVQDARIDALTREQRVFERLAASADPYTKARLRGERELSRAAAAASNLVVQGRLREEDAIQSLMAIEQAHIDRLQKVTTAQQGVTDSVQQSTAALGRQRTALAGANDNLAQTGNIAAQFQDIGVTATMGMNPLMIALQQGTQLSSVLNQMKNPLAGLGAAFVSIINPVSLLTIGFVALGAAAIQMFQGSEESAEEAKTALEEHNEWLDRILVGYDDVRDAAQRAADEAARLPQGVVASDLAASLQSQEDALQGVADRAVDMRNELEAALGIAQASLDMGNSGFSQGIVDQIKSLSDLRISMSSTREELEAVQTTARELFNSTEDAGIRRMADNTFQLANEMMGLQGAIQSTEAAQTSLNMTDLSGMESWADISRDLAAMQDELFRASGAAAWAIANSGNAAAIAAGQYGTAEGAANAYANALWRLGSMIPQVAAAQAAFGQLKQAESAYSAGLAANRDLIEAGGISLDEYARRQRELNSTYEQAQDAVTGVTAAEEQLQQLQSQNRIGGLEGRERAIAQVNHEYAERIERIEELANTGADQATVDRLLTQTNDEFATALANTDPQFDRMASDRKEAA